jgi:hypothetical protein
MRGKTLLEFRPQVCEHLLAIPVHETLRSLLRHKMTPKVEGSNGPLANTHASITSNTCGSMLKAAVYEQMQCHSCPVPRDALWPLRMECIPVDTMQFAGRPCSPGKPKRLHMKNTKCRMHSGDRPKRHKHTHTRTHTHTHTHTHTRLSSTCEPQKTRCKSARVPVTETVWARRLQACLCKVETE